VVPLGGVPRAAKASLTLSNLAPAPGSNKAKRRKGRGEGSGMGKYATRGMKGTKSRAGGGVALGFEGGQSPLWRRTPKIGYMPAMLHTPWEPLNLDTLAAAVASGRVDGSRRITMKALYDAGLFTSIPHGVKLLGRGATAAALPALDIEVSAASASAITAVEAAGGRVRSVYYSPLALRSHLQPAKFDLPIKSPRPPPALEAYYRSWAARGYLCPDVQLADLKARLAAGVPLPRAAALLPLYAGGPVERAAPAGLLPAGADRAALTSATATLTA